MATGGGWPLALLAALLVGGGALPETDVVRVLHPDAAGATQPPTEPRLTLFAVSRVQCAARCVRLGDCMAISYAAASEPAGGGACTLRRCPAGWSGRGASCYFISPEEVPRSEAAARCASLGAALATITSQQEHDDVGQLALDRGVKRVYLGLRHQPPYSGRQYAWEDGSALSFTRWGDNNAEPYVTDPPSERGVYLQAEKDVWHTWHATYSFNYVCEYVVQ